ncbi:helix-turn-helix domain-containing protein [Listeria booriae]|uniref:Helix-turn-helix domain-containing protein n=2 Tax=Listeria booriae TaxID=1552123 RepID=A0A7X0Z9S5_9LIST|nr:helix-turn-helix domain-containing protein [Listeria booriae]
MLSTRLLFDEFGNPHVCVDEDLRRRIEAKLVRSYFHLMLCE